VLFDPYQEKVLLGNSLFYFYASYVYVSATDALCSSR